MIDQKGCGYSSGTRGANFSLYDSHEWIGTMLQNIKSEKPLFLVGHSMGCLNLQTFLINNPNLPLAGVLFTAPFFAFPKHAGMNKLKRFLMRTVS